MIFIVVRLRYILHIRMCQGCFFDSVQFVGDTEESLISDLKFRFVQVLSVLFVTRAWCSPLFVCGFLKFGNRFYKFDCF